MTEHDTKKDDAKKEHAPKEHAPQHHKKKSDIFIKKNRAMERNIRGFRNSTHNINLRRNQRQ